MKSVEKPPRNSAGFCGGGQGLSWAVKPMKEERSPVNSKFGVDFLCDLQYTPILWEN
jgi:hypothetical protein